MLGSNLFRPHRARKVVYFNVCWLPLALVTLTPAWLASSPLQAGDPPTDVPALASPDTVGNDETAEKTSAGPASALADSTATPSDGSEQPSTAPAKPRGNARRLPAYYGTVVDAQQRAAIYEIRARIDAQLQPLRQQIEAIQQAELAEIEGLLSAEQLHRIEALRAQRAKSDKAPQAATPRQS